MKLAPIGLGLALLVPLLPVTAEAQPRERLRTERPAASRDLPFRGFEAPRATPVCVPWCAWDSNPCDPPEYKKADGRCFQDG